jgi:hypothetical protein
VLNNRKALFVAYRISNAQAVESALSTTNSATVPPSLSPSWGSAKTLWIVSVRKENNDFVSVISSAPTGFSQTAYLETTDGAGASDATDCQLMTATQNLEASSITPDGFTATGDLTRTYEHTIAVRPTI